MNSPWVRGCFWPGRDGAGQPQDNSAAPASAVTEAPAKAKEVTWEMTVNDNVDKFIKTPLEKVFFFDLVFWDNDAVAEDGITPRNIKVPIVVLWLIHCHGVSEAWKGCIQAFRSCRKLVILLLYTYKANGR